MLVKSAKLVDFVLVLSANLNLVAHGILLLLRQLRNTLLAVILVIGMKVQSCHPPANHLVSISAGLGETEM